MNDEESATYVLQSGLAVHQGENVMAAEGSHARFETHSDAQIHYYFPIEVVIAGDIGEEIKCEIEARIWDKLNSALS